MKPGLNVGDCHSFRMEVLDRHLVCNLFPEANGGNGAFPDMPPVFATAYMTGLMEWACVEQIKPYYEETEDSLGVDVCFDHTAPTLSGQVVTVETEIEEIDGRFIWFRVRAHDGIDQIGQGRHRRAVISRAKFQDRLAARRAALAKG